MSLVNKLSAGVSNPFPYNEYVQIDDAGAYKIIVNYEIYYNNYDIDTGSSNDYISIMAYGWGGNINTYEGDDFIRMYNISGGDGSAGTIHGGDGNDTIGGFLFTYVYGDAGDDIVGGGLNAYGGDGNDTVSSEGMSYGGPGDDVVSAYTNGYGGDGNDIVTAGEFLADGGRGDDWLSGPATSGGEGDDYLRPGLPDQPYEQSGGAGDDVIFLSSLSTFYGAGISGGAGADVFVISDAFLESHPKSAGIVELLDFESQDRIALPFSVKLVSRFDGGSGEAVVREGPAGENSFYYAGPDVPVTIVDIDVDGDGRTDIRIQIDSNAVGMINEETFLNTNTAPTAGGDLVQGAALADLVCGDRGNDTLLGGDGNDRLIGFWGDDVLVGGVGSDRVVGGAGNDTLVGGAGKDVLIGGSGSDQFVFGPEDSRPGGGRRDVISDFERGLDKIDLSGLGITSFSQLSFKTTGSGLIVYGDLHNDGFDWQDFGVQVTGLRALSADDFIFA